MESGSQRQEAKATYRYGAVQQSCNGVFLALNPFRATLLGASSR